MKAELDKRKLLKSKADSLTESEVAEVLEYIAIMQAMSGQTDEPELFYRALAGVFFRAKNMHKGRALRQ